MNLKRYFLLAALGLALPLATIASAAYPERPVKIVSNSAAGSPLDLLARVIAAKAGESLKQTVIVENRSGASGMIGAEAVAHSKPDGYTLLLALDTLVTVNPSVYKRSPFNPRSELEPIAFIGSFNQVLVAPARLGVHDLAGFLALAAKQELTYASAGVGSPGHLSMEAFRLAVQVPMRHIPYKSGSAAINDLLGGQVDTGFLVIGGVLPHIRSGKLVPLAVSGTTRNALLPDVPMLAETGIAGLKNFDGRFGYLLMAPKGTPSTIVSRWNSVLHEVMRKPEAAEKLKILDIQPAFGSPADAARWIDTNARNWARVVQQAHIAQN